MEVDKKHDRLAFTFPRPPRVIEEKKVFDIISMPNGDDGTRRWGVYERNHYYGRIFFSSGCEGFPNRFLFTQEPGPWGMPSSDMKDIAEILEHLIQEFPCGT